MKPRKKILFVLLNPSKHEVDFLKGVARKIEEKGGDTMFFLMSEGVKMAEVLRHNSVYLCSRNAREFGVREIKGVVFGSQYDLSRMVEEADRVIVFG